MASTNLNAPNNQSVLFCCRLNPGGKSFHKSKAETLCGKFFQYSTGQDGELAGKLSG